MANINRRRFLKTGSAMGFMAGTGLLGALGHSNAFAADTSGYKALVCVFFKGGMDAIDTVLPYDVESYESLKTVRAGLFGSYGVGSGTSPRDRENLLELTPENSASFGGRKFALPPQMAALHSAFEAGDAAIVGNVGPLIEPLTRDSYTANSLQIPDRLFSHNDQQSTWMALAPEGAQTGWGGKFSDAVISGAPGGNTTFTAVSASGADVFLAGNLAKPFTAALDGAQTLDVLRQQWRLGYGADEDRAREILKEHLASKDIDAANLFTKDVIASNGRAVENGEAYANAIEASLGVSTPFPSTSLGKQLKTVAQSISVRNVLGVSRQVFYVSIGGFDTHDNQANSLPALHTQISEAFAAFRAAMKDELSVWDDVTLFTGSDFGRTGVDNGDGTDHGWGAHHIVMGGGVNGKNIYGELPDYDFGGQSYTDTSGRLIPAVSVEQYAATLGRWFGLSDSELLAALPNLQNFSVQDLGLFGGLT